MCEACAEEWAAIEARIERDGIILLLAKRAHVLLEEADEHLQACIDKRELSEATSTLLLDLVQNSPLTPR